MTLEKVKRGLRVKVLGLDKELLQKYMIMGVGIVPGEEIEVVSSSFLGSPITLRLSTQETLAMRKVQAKQITVEVL